MQGNKIWEWLAVSFCGRCMCYNVNEQHETICVLYLYLLFHEILYVVFNLCVSVAHHSSAGLTRCLRLQLAG